MLDFHALTEDELAETSQRFDGAYAKFVWNKVDKAKSQTRAVVNKLNNFIKVECFLKVHYFPTDILINL